MDIKKKQFNQNFYDFLKNAQPLAFLASFSMIITVFSYPQEDLESIYQNAAMAASLFVISFVFSMMSQFLIIKEESEKNEPSFYPELIRYGTYFFFAIGSVYLILIVVEFGKNFESLFVIFISWISLFVGVSFLAMTVKHIYALTKVKEELVPYDGMAIPMGISLFISVFMYGLNNVAKGLFHLELGEPMEFFAILFISAMLYSIILFPYRLIHRMQEKQKIKRRFPKAYFVAG